MAIVPSLSVLQRDFQNYLSTGGLKKGSGYTFGHDAKDRMSFHRNNYMRVSFVPCSAGGRPLDAPGAFELFNDILRKGQDIYNRAGLDFWKLIFRGIQVAAGAEVSGRKVVHLYTNPYKATFRWAREEGQEEFLRDPDAPTPTPHEGKPGENHYPVPYDNKVQSVTALRGKTSHDWLAPTGTIELSGSCGNAPELQIPRLKYIFGMQDPSAPSRAKNIMVEGNTRYEDQKGGGSYVLDASMYLWEMWYPVVYYLPEENPYPHLQIPARYFGYVKSLLFTQAVGDNSAQTDITWVMKFTVLQRRDYDKAYNGP